MKTNTLFYKLKLKIRRFSRRLKTGRSKIDLMGEKTTKSMQKNGAWVTGEKLHNTPMPYSPYDRANMPSVFSVILLFVLIVGSLWLIVKLTTLSLQ